MLTLRGASTERIPLQRLVSQHEALSCEPQVLEVSH
jgi:hypothetical protein